jgi:hypothetical protein
MNYVLLRLGEHFGLLKCQACVADQEFTQLFEFHKCLLGVRGRVVLWCI